MRPKAFAIVAGLGSALILSLVLGTVGNAADDAPLAPALQDHRNPAVLRTAGGERPIKTPEQWAKRRAGIVEGMQLVMGKLPDRATFPPLDVKPGEPAKHDGYSRVPLTYDADGIGRVPAHLYLPEPREPGRRYPAIVALHQTSVNGKDDLGGGAKNPNNSYVPELARRGYVVICPDYPSFGELKDYDFATDPYESGTMKAIVNHMRAVDVLAGRNDVDAERIGAIGHSLGGHNAIFLGVFDPRVKVVVTSCGWTPFHDYYKGNLKGWTQDRYMPRVRDVYESKPDKMPFDFPELIAAIAPRAFFSVSPTRDANFEVEGVRRAEAAAKPVYELLGAADKLRVVYPDDEHNFAPEMRQAAYAFIDTALGNEKPSVAKNDVPVEEQDFSGELPRIPAKEPAEALKLLKTLPGFRVELAAAEPNVASPVAIAFDERGRMFVCEMRDYSEQDTERLGTIRMLEDADGDGTFEKATAFAGDLSWPTALACYDGGLFVAAAPDIFWLKDTDGDGKADERKVVFTGFNRSNVQGLINSFHWGLDNRIHGATSTSGGKVRRPEDPESKAVNLSGRDFSFDPRTLDLRPESGGAQHGMSFDDWGRKFVSANSDHIQMVMIDDRYLAANPHLTVPSARESIAADGPQARVFRISPVEPWRIVRTRLRASGAVKGIVEFGGQPAGYFTGATGVTIYRGDAFPDTFRGNAFCGDVGSNIVHRKILEPNGVGLIAKRADENVEFLASSDIWFRPSQFANAPDGTLYVIDTCREVIEHPASLPPMIKKHLDLTSGRDRGRIWRVVPEKFGRRPTTDLGKASTEELVKLVEHRNGWHRDTAARLLYQRQDEAAVPMLEKVATSAKMPEARVHAMYALAGLGGNELSEALIDRGLEDQSPRVREHAVRLFERAALAKNQDNALQKLTRLASDPDPRVRYQVALTYGLLADGGTADVAETLLRNTDGDRWLRAAALAVAAEDPAETLDSLLAQQNEWFVASDAGRSTLKALTRQIGQANKPEHVTAALRAAASHQAVAADLLAGLSEGLSAAGVSLRDRVAGEPAIKATFERMLADARKTAADPKASAAARAAAVRLLGTDSFAANRAAFTAALADGASGEVQLAALATLDRFDEPEVGAILTKAWPGMTPAVRAAAANVIFARPDRAAAFLDAVEAGKIKAADVDRGRLKTLEAGDNAALRERAKKLLAAGSNKARQEVFESYRPALSLAGDAGRGKAVFETSCAACHRVNDVGQEIGPNLAAMKARGAEAILLNVIDPNAEVNPLFVSYVVQTKSGRTTSGMLASETPGAITLKRAGNETETISRADVRRMRSSGLSIMPEGLEQGIDHQQMADLIAYILSTN